MVVGAAEPGFKQFNIASPFSTRCLMMCPFLGLWAHATARDAGSRLKGRWNESVLLLSYCCAKVPFPIVPTGRPGLVVPGRPPFFKQTNENAMFLQEIAFKLISMAESPECALSAKSSTQMRNALARFARRFPKASGRLVLRR